MSYNIGDQDYKSFLNDRLLAIVDSCIGIYSTILWILLSTAFAISEKSLELSTVLRYRYQGFLDKKFRFLVKTC